MKKMMFKKGIDPEKRVKTLAIHSQTEDQSCRTQVQKSFKYAVHRKKKTKCKLKAPLVFIRKSFDTKRGIEEFGFHVKGYFYITHNGEAMKVRFHHTLDIKIKWKIKDFSPKKSVTLT